MGLCRATWNRIHFARQLYLWGWRWVVFVMWGLPYAVIGVYDTAIGQGFLPSNYPKLAPLIPDWLPQAWLYVGIVLLFAVTFEGAFRITRKRNNRKDNVLYFAELVNKAKGLRISKVNSSTPKSELDMILKEAITWTIKALADISIRVDTATETAIRSKNELPLQGEIKEEDFYATFACDNGDAKLNLVRKRCYDVRNWLQDYVSGLPPEFYK